MADQVPMQQLQASSPASPTSAAAAGVTKPKKEKTTLERYKQSFREYLKETSAVRDEAELDQLMALLHEPLPVSFRVNLHRPDAQKVQALLATEHQFPADTFVFNGTPITPPKPIAWYPLPNVAWQMDCGRTALSKSAPKHAPVKAFHSCLLEHTEMGTIDRQEAVSMLPVLFLDVQPAQRVLDMCASPGSKTTQVIDFLLSADGSNGMVIANDLDKKRAYMLVHRLTRNTLRNAVVTCGAGDTFPGLYERGSGMLQTTNVFDRVLCDVPCSGDGTLRKNQTLWKEWHIGQGLTLHPVQLALALRGAALLKVGGVMVYSTCSFNPVENEAVVAELLRRSGGALELVDVSEKLPSLVYRKGRSAWHVGWRSKSKSSHKGHLFKAASASEVSAGNDSGASADSTTAQLHEWYASYDAIPQELRGQRVVRSMFAPAAADSLAKELEKTLRLIPTDQNSGGFFIAVLRKTADLPGADQQGLAALDEDLTLTPPEGYVCKLCGAQGHFMKHCEKFDPNFQVPGADSTPKAKKQRTDDSATPYVKPRETLYRPISDDAWEVIQSFYGIEDAGLKARFWCRSDGAANVNYVDEEISDACLGGDALEIVNTGLKVFTKKAERGVTYYRPSEEALGFIDQFFTKRVLTLAADDFARLLHASAHLPFESLAASAQEFLNAAGVGPGVAQLATNARVAINIWIGVGAVLPRVSKTMRTEVDHELTLASSNGRG